MTACVLPWGEVTAAKEIIYLRYTQVMMFVQLFFSDSSFHKYSKGLWNKLVFFPVLKQSLCKGGNHNTRSILLISVFPTFQSGDLGFPMN